jgi:hypothetical protein
MDDRPEPEPIEIGLTSNDTSPAEGDRWSRRRPERWEADGSEVIVRGPSDGEPARPDPEQRRRFALAAIVGVVALGLGWLIGRTGGGGDDSTSSLTTPVTTESTTESSAPGDSLPSAAPTTARPRPTTTTTIPPGLAPLELYLVDVDPRLEGVELTLIGFEPSVLAELDLARETLIRRETDPFTAEPGWMTVGDDWVVLSNGGDETNLLVHDDGSSERVELGQFRQAGTEQFWRPTFSGGWEPATRFELVDLTGRPVGGTIELPAATWPLGSDPAGGLVVEAAGDVYSIDESSVEYLGPGELIGMSSEIVVTRDCDDQLRCGLSVTDRRSGDVRRLDVDPADGGMLQSLHGWSGSSAEAISPDGSMCVVIVESGGGPRLGLIDLSSGEFADIGNGGFLPAVVWSPDDRFAFFIANSDESGSGWGWGWGSGDLFGYDRATRELFPVLSEPVEWQAVAARPAPA